MTDRRGKGQSPLQIGGDNFDQLLTVIDGLRALKNLWGDGHLRDVGGGDLAATAGLLLAEFDAALTGG